MSPRIVTACCSRIAKHCDSSLIIAAASKITTLHRTSCIGSITARDCSKLPRCSQLALWSILSSCLLEARLACLVASRPTQREMPLLVCSLLLQILRFSSSVNSGSFWSAVSCSRCRAYERMLHAVLAATRCSQS
jgi:hypothetical protein